MYAVIRTGGKQYKVQPGDVLKVEKIEQNLGSEFDLTDVLMVGGEKLHVGQPVLQNAKVTVVVIKQARAPKVIVFKKKRRQGYRRTQGHRQYFTELFIKAITAPDGQTVKTEKEPKIFDAEAKKQAKQEAKAVAAEGKTAGAKKKVAKAATKKTTKKAATKSTKKAGTTKKAATKKKTTKKTK
ncbi:MAG: ribosomal protein [Pseudomonadota bacterium]|jgi:large subunit ribosomal protein L21